MRSILRLFFKAKAANPWLVVACLVFASVAEGIGVATLIPLITVATGGDLGGGGKRRVFGEIAQNFFEFFGTTPTLVPLLMVFLATMAVKAGLSLVAMRYVGNATAEVATDMRRQIIEGLLQVRWGFFADQKLGKIANAVSGEAMRAASAYLVAATLLAAVVSVVIYLAVAVTISWQLTAIATIFGSAIAVALHTYVRRAKKAGRIQGRRLRTIVIALIETINNIKSLKAMGRQDRFARFLDSKIADLRFGLRREVWLTESRRRMEELLIAAFLAGAFYVSIEILKYDIAKVIVMGLLLARTMGNIGRIQAAYQRATFIEHSYEDIQKLIRETRRAKENLPTGDAPTLERGIRFDSVAFAYDEHVVFEKASFEVPVGQITVLTGPSGSGKPTLTDVMIGLSKPAAAQILVDDQPLDQLDAITWRRMIGYVPQEIVLLHDSVLANITLGDETITEADAREALGLAGALAFVDALPEGLMTVVGERGSRLSGGQRQRVALARALATKPKLLILDEVTSALDPQTEAEICQTIASLPRDMAVVAVTHRPAFLGVADRVLRVENGAVDLISVETARHG
jgi:ATP-binding cassette subfamily C protein